VGEAVDRFETIVQVRQPPSNVIGIDIAKPKMDGGNVARRIKAGWSDRGNIGLPMFDGEKNPHDTLQPM